MKMTDRETLIGLIDRIPDEDIPVVRSVLARFVPGLTLAELKALADSGVPDPEALSDAERQGFAEAEAYLAGNAQAIVHEDVLRGLRESATL